MKKILKQIIEKTGYQISRKNIRMDFVSFAKDKEFEDAFLKVKPFSLLDKDRLFMLWQFVKQAKAFPGAFAQVGVFRGGSAKLVSIAKKENSEPLYLFDTFEGMPEVDESVDLHKKGDFKNTSLEGVQELFTGEKSVIFCKGFFPATVDKVHSDKFSFVYIDVDIYKSVLDSLNFFYPKLVTGGFMMFDDYMGKNTPGVKKALDEFLKDKKEIPILTTVGQCVLIKQ
ncbi:MAG: O-methyltransferase [Patescibacteria group bacterium]|jgi:hypothetical protein|nr:O-methyltransferase [Patescibacteria group bacterium]